MPRLILLASAVLFASPATAQQMPGMDMSHRPTKPRPAARPTPLGTAGKKPVKSVSRTPVKPAAAAAAPSPAAARQMPGMDMSAPPAAPEAPAAAQTMPAMDMSVPPSAEAPAIAGHADHAQVMPGMAMDPAGPGMMSGMLGAYGMTRDASGTAWQPESAPMDGRMTHIGGWSAMLHGFATAIYDDQGGPRGQHKAFVASMLMGMAQRPLAGGALTLRAMLSLDPLMGKSGYPLLLATGETADGRTELVDRQHPHDAIMELSATYSHQLGSGVSGFVYLGLPGEPALGPATYMHRFSGLANPEAPIGHHWLDSTHVTFGVASAGLVYRGVKLEGSVFTGREPDQHRWDIERPRMDSWSLRATWNPTPDWSMQLSHGFLHSPEQLQPEENVRRTTASVTYNRPLAHDGNWQTTLAWGRNAPSGGDGHHRPTDALLLDSAVQIGRWTAFGRGEIVDKDELFDGDAPLAGRTFTVGKLSLGGFRSVPLGPVSLDLGGLVSKYALPSAIRPIYGAGPTSFMLFTRVRIAG